jgi:hypothetical protein
LARRGVGTVPPVTSGSAVFYDENTHLPLPASVFAPESAGVHPLLVASFAAAVAARCGEPEVIENYTQYKSVCIDLS